MNDDLYFSSDKAFSTSLCYLLDFAICRFLDQRDAINGGYSHWSSWSTCSKSCAGGVRRRMRKCTNPAPSNGGRDCRSVGPSVESQDCNVKSCNSKRVIKGQLIGKELGPMENEIRQD